MPMVVCACNISTNVWTSFSGYSLPSGETMMPLMLMAKSPSEMYSLIVPLRPWISVVTMFRDCDTSNNTVSILKSSYVICSPCKFLYEPPTKSKFENTGVPKYDINVLPSSPVSALSKTVVPDGMSYSLLERSPKPPGGNMPYFNARTCCNPNDFKIFAG